ncbi:MAG TPA: alpha/beta hydrolase [Candidatus Binataceae bacterium]|nr:alpha/beta hydrolase [Candidatus Binataceae bacterium]
MPTKYVHINGHAVYLHYAGKTTLPDVVPDFSKGRAVVMIHGAGGNGHSWHKQIAHLSKEHSPLAIDLPGHGRSSGVDGMNSIREYADFILALLDVLQIKSAVIAGHSMGGAIAMQMALKNPIRAEALMLVATAARFNIAPDRISGLRDVMMGRAPQAFLTDAYSPRTIKENFDLVREGWMEQIKTDPRVRYTDMVACDKTDLRGDIDKITNPTMILAGADDAITTPADAEGIGSKIRGSKIEVIADGGHALPWEKPAEVNAAFDNFLAGLK